MKEKMHLRILFVEDVPSDFELAERELKKAGIQFTSLRVETKAAFLEALKEFKPDLIVSDYVLPEFDGMQALKLAQEFNPLIPFIVLTGSMNELTAVACMKAGATDYVIKEHRIRLPFAVKEALENKKLHIEKEQSRKSLEESELRHRTFIESTSDMVFLKDDSFKHIIANKMLCAFFGKSLEEVIGKTDFELLPIEAARKCRGTDAATLQTSSLMVREEMIGSQCYETVKFRVTLHDGKIGVGGYIRDISIQKEAEKVLAESEQKFKWLFEFAPVAYHVLAPNGTLLDVNAKWCEMLGYTKEEVVGTSIFTYIVEHERSEAQSHFVRKKMDASTFTERHERTFAAKDRTLRIALVSDFFTQGKDGKVVTVQTTLEDITERKRAEEALKRSETRFRSVWESSIDGMRLTDKEGTIVLVNDAYCQLAGAAKEELEGQSFNEVYRSSEKENQLATQFYKERFLERGIPPKTETTLELKANGPVSVEISNAFLDSAGGQPLLLSIFRDITERKQAEKALQESMERYKNLTKISPVGIFHTDENGLTTYVNPKWSQISGVSFEKALGDNWLNAVHPDDKEKLIKEWQEATRFHKTSFTDYRFVRPDGTIAWVIGQAIPERNPENKIVGYIGTITDITERMEAEEALRQRAEEVHTLMETTPAAIWVAHDQKCLQITGNKAANSFYEAADQENVSAGSTAVRRFFRNGKELSADELTMQQAVDIGQDVRDSELDVLLPSGKWITILGNATPLRDSSGNVRGCIGVFIDITERRQASEALRESESRFRLVWEKSTDGMRLTNEEGIIVSANKAYCAMVEKPYEELAGKPMSIVYEKSRQVEVLQKHQERFHSHCISAHLERDLVLWNGKRISLSLSNTALEIPNQPALSLSVFRDVTIQKQIDAKLRESEEYYRTLIETTPDAIAIVDTKGMMTFASSKSYMVFGVPPNHSILGRSFLTWVHPDDRDRITKRLHEILSLGSDSVIHEYQFLKFDGTPFWGEINTSQLLDANGNITELLVMCRDVTEKRKLQQELAQSQKLQSIGTLAGGIAHDFNNVLGIILGYTSFLEVAAIPPEKKAEAIVVIKNAVQRGAALVRQILTFARKSEVLFEPMNLADLLHELLSMLQGTFPKIITFKEVIEKELPLISADRTQMHQALLNLCVNARDAMPNGGCITFTMEKKTGEELRERFPAAEMGSYLFLGVADTGEGMTEATRLKIFDPFFTTKEKGKGTGLGLSVVFGVVKAHHGFIDVESVVGRGTTFRLYFPFSLSGKIMRAPQKQEDSIESGGTETILLVEDEESLMEMARLTLESHGYHVYAAQDGLKAVEMYRIHHKEIALVITDIGLPGMTGMDAFHAFKEINPDVKLLFMSGSVEPEVAARLLEAGAKGFIHKPYSQREMLQRLRAVLEEKGL